MELVAQKQAQGYDAIGLDNYDPMNNHYGACGVWRNDSAGHRKWVQLYSGQVSGDHKFTQAAVDWLGRLKARVNALKSKRGNAMMSIPNYSLGGQKWNDSIVLQIGNNTDGIMTESGFTGGGGGSSATNTTHGKMPQYRCSSGLRSSQDGRDIVVDRPSLLWHRMGAACGVQPQPAETRQGILHEQRVWRLPQPGQGQRALRAGSVELHRASNPGVGNCQLPGKVALEI